MKYILFSFLSLLLCASCNNTEKKQSNVDLPLENNPLGDDHNSRNSLDWAGTYSGVLPCETCRGVETYLTLNADNTYSMTRSYLESEMDSNDTIQDAGTFSWDESGGAITLKGLLKEMPVLKVGELFLIPLDVNGFEIKAEPGNNFKLLKQ